MCVLFFLLVMYRDWLDFTGLYLILCANKWQITSHEMPPTGILNLGGTMSQYMDPIWGRLPVALLKRPVTMTLLVIE